MGLDRAADILADSILKRRRYVSFPWPLAWLSHLTRSLPAGLYDRLIRKLDKR
jgi:hypothetical protein